MPVIMPFAFLVFKLGIIGTDGQIYRHLSRRTGEPVRGGAGPDLIAALRRPAVLPALELPARRQAAAGRLDRLIRGEHPRAVPVSDSELGHLTGQ